jgi:predicted NAD-dependent protein-ADP-ribosyltransferase YbiA (DUF1768 family)
MAVRFRSPADQPYGCFHPRSRFHGFREGGTYWPSVAQYCLAQRLASREDRERVRTARDPEHACELAASMPTIDGWKEQETDVLTRALLLSFQANLPRRAVLVATGDEPIEADIDDPELGIGPDGRGENRLGRALMEARAVVRRRAEDPEAIQCEHQDPEAVRLACEHLLADGAWNRPFHRSFTGQGSAYNLICPACFAALPKPPPLRKICGDCHEGLHSGNRGPDAGAPVFPERATDLRFEHRTVRLPGLDEAEIIAITPIPLEASVWLMLDKSGRLHRVDLARGCSEAGGAAPDDAIDRAVGLTLRAAPDGRLAAIAEREGRRAVVIEPATGRITMRILRDNYHEKHCPFPIAFFAVGARLYLAHATAWNRLDVSDPATGEILTARLIAPYEKDTRPPHYLDYFHADLIPSPDGERVIDNGWVWHPSGCVRAFSLRRWVEENLYESEDGPTVKELCWREYYWGGPVAWLDATTVAVWGLGDDDRLLTPGARVFNGVTGEEIRSFAGPAQGFASQPPYLIAFDNESGTSVWDVTTGERLAREPGLCPIEQHPASRELISRVPGEGFRVSRLVGASLHQGAA